MHAVVVYESIQEHQRDRGGDRRRSASRRRGRGRSAGGSGRRPRPGRRRPAGRRRADSHARMTSSMSRKMAVKAAEDEGLEVEPGAAEGLGLRSWLRDQAGDGTRAAAFDTRADASPAHGNGGAPGSPAAAPAGLRDGQRARELPRRGIRGSIGPRRARPRSALGRGSRRQGRLRRRQVTRNDPPVIKISSIAMSTAVAWMAPGRGRPSTSG